MLTALVTVASLVLAAVFAAAGLAKLSDRDGTRTAIVGFGVPGRLADVLSVGLPAVELGVAVLLLPPATAAYGAVGAFALLATFTAAIARSLAQGRTPECRCFGNLHSAPVGGRTMARNGILAALALVVVGGVWIDPGSRSLSWIGHPDGLEWLVVALLATLAVVTTACAYVIAHVLRSYGAVLVRLEKVEARLRAAGLELEGVGLDDVPQLGLEPGSTAPAFWLPSTEGDHVALDDLLQPGRPVLLLFTSPTCGPCHLLMPEVARWQQEHADALTIALLSDGDPESIRADAAKHRLVNVLVDETLSAYEAYGASGTPSAVLVGDDGTIASWLATGGDWIEMLVEQASAERGRTPGLPAGSELPSLRLATLDGGERELRELVTGPTVVLFWNPRCGFCRAMHEDLLAWERESPEDAPGLLVVSSGAAEEIGAEGFASSVLLDPDWSASAALGADGTPMALLLDEHGRIASPVVTGAVGVLALLGVGDLSAV